MNLAHLWHNTAREIITSYLAGGRIFKNGLINNEFYSRAITIIKNTNDVRYISKLMQIFKPRNIVQIIHNSGNSCRIYTMMQNESDSRKNIIMLAVVLPQKIV